MGDIFLDLFFLIFFFFSLQDVPMKGGMKRTVSIVCSSGKRKITMLGDCENKTKESGTGKKEEKEKNKSYLTKAEGLKLVLLKIRFTACPSSPD